MKNKEYDIIIIGTGAGGATILHELAPTGKNILVLERGDFLPREKENLDSKEVFIKERYVTKEKWLDEKNKEFRPGQHYWVGGNTKMYGATLLRMREKDFEEVQHIDGVSEQWPLKYLDFESYYQRAEELYHVHGKGNIDPTEPERSNEFPYSPLVHEERIQKLNQDLEACGLTPFPLPTGVLESDEKRSKVVLDRLDGYPDITETKADAHTACITPSLEYENVTLHTNTYVEKLVTNKSGTRVTEVIANIDGNKIRYKAKVVIVSCGAINSAALFLRSKSKMHPDGLGNGSDLVGRNLMLHNNSVFMAISKTVNNTKFGKTIGINDFYFASDKNEYPLGHIQMLGKVDDVIIGSGAPKSIPKFLIKKLAQHTIDMWVTTEDLPLYENRVSVTEDGQIKIEYKRTNLKAHEMLIKKFAGFLDKLGCYRYFYKSQLMGMDKASHQCGTMRFGNNPKDSVLDLNCKVHDLENTYVVDASFFVTSSSVNPALTVMANSIRIADHIKKYVI